MARGYKTTGGSSSLPRVLAAALLAVLLAAGGFAAGQWAAPHEGRGRAPAPGLRYEQGVPRGFPATARGAGDAAAWYVSLLSERAGAPRREVEGLLRRLAAPGAAKHVVEALMPPQGTEGNTNIWQFSPLRVWAEGAGDRTTKPAGAVVKAELYGLVVIGGRSDGQTVPDNATTGGFYLQEFTMLLHERTWKLQEVSDAVEAAPPTINGTIPDDGAGYDQHALARVLGPESWIPHMR